MANFGKELPIDLIHEFENLNINTPKMMAAMTIAGAKVVKKNVETNMSKSFKSSESIKKCLSITKTYITPSDDSINNKIIITGYLNNNKNHPAPIAAMSREYGNSRGEAKKPFFRKSFKKNEIEAAMLKEQNKFLPKG